MSYENDYLDLLEQIVDDGEARADRTGVGTRSIFGARLIIDLQREFPLLTTKRVFWRGVVEELLWIVRGSGDISELTERDVHIWDEWDEGFRWAPYGPALRGCYPSANASDQVHELIRGLREDPSSRRHVLTTWIPGDVERTGTMGGLALPPCHGLVTQFYVRDGEFLDCQTYQRSADMFLGVPFNLASYALLTHLVAAQAGYKPGTLTWLAGDAHVYSNHVSVVATQLHRIVDDAPLLRVMPGVESIDDYRFEDLALVGYSPQRSLRAPVAV